MTAGKNRNFSSKTLGSTKKTTSTPKTMFKTIMVIIAVAVVFAFSIVLVSGFKNAWEKIKESTINIVSKQVGTEMKRDIYGNVNILLLGYGGDGHDGGYLTDSIIVASRNPEIGNISMFSIPRDLRVKYPNNGYGRINGVLYQYLKKSNKDLGLAASGTASSISSMLDMEIPYYATIDFKAFKGIVDTIGGVDIIVPETIHDTTYPNEANRGYITFHIDAGEQHLDGETALKYARSRHSTSDFSRSLRQQLIIKGIKDKIFLSGVDISTVQDLYEQYKTYVTTNISLSEMLWTVQYIHTIGEFTSFGFTTYCGYQSYKSMAAACFLYIPKRESFGGASVILPIGATATNVQHYDAMQTFTRFILSHPKFIKERASIEVLNGIDKQLAREKGMSSTPFAGNLAVKLKRYGFTIADTQNTEVPQATSYIQINNYGDFSGTIQAIQTFLPIQEIKSDFSKVSTGLDIEGNEVTFFDGTDISLVIGADYLQGSESLSGLVQKKFTYDL